MKKLLFGLLATFIITQSVNAQYTSTDKNVNVLVVDSTTLPQVAKDSDKKNTLFYTFGVWCEPCRLHLPTAMKLAKDHDLNFYVLLVDGQQTKHTKNAIAFLRSQDENIQIAILSDEVYGEKTRKRNKKFVNEITPSTLEAIDDFSKYILLNNEGKVLMVTNYKDNEGNDWRDDSKMVEKVIVPLLR